MYWNYELLTVAAIQDGADGPEYTLTAETASFVLSGQQMVPARSLLVSAEAGAFSLSGQALDFLLSRAEPLDLGPYALSGQQLTVVRSLRLSLELGSVAFNGQQLDFTTLSEVIGQGTRWLNQIATYWARSSDDGFGGYSYGARRRYAVRWEDRVEELRTKEGELIVSDAVVWVTERLEEGGYLYLGLSDETDPTSLHDAHVIRKVVETPSIRGESVEYRVYL